MENVVKGVEKGQDEFEAILKHGVRELAGMMHTTYMKRLIFYLICILSGISILLWYLLWILIDMGVIAIFYDALVVIIVTIAIFITWMKTPQFIDNFYIRSELRWITATVASGIISVVLIWSSVGYIGSLTQCSSQHWSVILVTNSYAIGMSANTLDQTKYVFYKCKDILHISSSNTNSNTKTNTNGINETSHSLKRQTTASLNLSRHRYSGSIGSNHSIRSNNSTHSIHTPATATTTSNMSIQNYNGGAGLASALTNALTNAQQHLHEDDHMDQSTLNNNYSAASTIANYTNNNINNINNISNINSSEQRVHVFG